jgi:DNA-binding beta-propeller fold protein YncE
LYVGDVEGTVTPISVATDTPGPPITVAPDLNEIVITPDSKRAYVLSYHGTVTPIVTATNTAEQPILIADAVDGGMVLAP